MLQVCRRISITLILSASLFLTSCAFFGEKSSLSRAPTEREQMFAGAEDFYNKGDFESAKTLYFRLSRNVSGRFDSIYDQSLWRLVKIYEKSDESEKALLSLDELSLRKASTISANKIKFAQMKNNFRVANLYQAGIIKKEIDEAYRSENLDLEEIFEILIDSTDLTYDHRMLEELLFLGEVQKYFVFVMESQLSPENEQLTDHLIKSYEHFFSLLKRSSLSADFKKKLSISLLDQLRKFDRYKLDSNETNIETLLRFSNYSEPKQKILIESFLK